VPAASIGIVTWNSARDLPGCLRAVRRLDGVETELLVADNASSDTTRDILEQATTPGERVWLADNEGFARAHNRLIARSRGAYYLALNPDVVLDRAYLARLIDALDRDPGAGSATGKLVRMDTPGVLDSTGIVMLPTQRHLDRGAGERDEGQYDRMEPVFGASAAAALYRRRMLEDTRVGDEYFDEDFFAYREDADLAWRAQLLGWRCLYVPEATAAHRRRVIPERRRELSAEVNRYSVRNRFLLRLKNQTAAQAVRFALPTIWRDAQVLGYVLLRERSSLAALADVVRLMPRTLAKRRSIMRRRRTSGAELDRWFVTPPGRGAA